LNVTFIGELEMRDWDYIEAGGGYDADSEADWNDERQPDEAQEWHDFDPDC